MGQTSRTGVDRRSQSLSDINALVASRDETLSLYGELAAHRPFSANQNFVEELQHFCEALIDYTANAHFRLYKHLADNLERRKAVQEVANRVYDQIAQTTDKILEFNDRYSEENCSKAIFEQVESDLSSIGEILAERIEYEDQVIAAMRRERRTIN